MAVGAVSARQVEQAEIALVHAKEDQLIDETVYGELAVDELTEAQAEAMKSALPCSASFTCNGVKSRPSSRSLPSVG